MTRFAIIACYGSHGRDRTCDKWINSPLLLPLSYARKMKHSKSKKVFDTSEIPVQGVGFEPTHANIADLKSAPLDLSGNLARKHYHIVFFLNEYDIYST